MRSCGFADVFAVMQAWEVRCTTYHLACLPACLPAYLPVCLPAWFYASPH